VVVRSEDFETRWAYARECALVGSGVLAGSARNPIAFVAAAADLAFSAAAALRL
jgi:hypothetical protein